MNVEEILKKTDTKDDDNKIIGLDEIYERLPFGKKKILGLIHAGELPVVKIGRTYVTTGNMLIRWIEDNVGQELYY